MPHRVQPVDDRCCSWRRLVERALHSQALLCDARVASWSLPGTRSEKPLPRCPKGIDEQTRYNALRSHRQDSATRPGERRTSRQPRPCRMTSPTSMIVMRRSSAIISRHADALLRSVGRRSAKAQRRLGADKLTLVPGPAAQRLKVFNFVIAFHGLSPCERQTSTRPNDPTRGFRRRSRANSSFGWLPTVDSDPEQNLTSTRYR